MDGYQICYSTSKKWKNKKTKADCRYKREDKESEKEENLLFPRPRLSQRRVKESVRSVEYDEEAKDQEIERKIY